MIFPEPGKIKLSQDERSFLVSLLAAWVETQSNPDTPEFFVMGRDYSPREILYEVAEATEFGDHLGFSLYRAAEIHKTSVQDMIGRAIVANKEDR